MSVLNKVPTKNNCKDNKLVFTITNRNSGKFEYHDITWNFCNQISLENYLKKCKYPFEYAGCIVKRDNENNKDISKRIGYKIELKEKFKKSDQLIYLMTICLPCGEKIIKGGKSKNSLDKRTYNAGTEHQWTMVGNCSETNYIYSQIFRETLKKNIRINFYIYSVEKQRCTYMAPCGKQKFIETSPYEEIEKELNYHLKKFLGKNLIGEGNLCKSYKD